MTYVAPVNYGYVPSYSTQTTTTNVQKAVPPTAGQPINIDCSKLYKPQEVEDILKRVGTDCKIQTMYKPAYSIEYYPKAEALVINNKNMTNDTTEILRDGSVRHVGSWHNKEVAPAGSYLDIIEDAKARIGNSQVYAR